MHLTLNLCGCWDTNSHPHNCTVISPGCEPNFLNPNMLKPNKDTASKIYLLVNQKLKNLKKRVKGIKECVYTSILTLNIKA